MVDISASNNSADSLSRVAQTLQFADNLVHCSEARVCILADAVCWNLIQKTCDFELYLVSQLLIFDKFLAAFFNSPSAGAKIPVTGCFISFLIVFQIPLRSQRGLQS